MKTILSTLFLVLLLGAAFAGSSGNFRTVSVSIGKGNCASGACGGHKTDGGSQVEENIEAPSGGAGQEQPAEEPPVEQPVTPPVVSTPKQSVVIKKKIVVGSCKSGHCGGKQPAEQPVEENVEAPSGGAGQEQPAGQEEDTTQTPSTGNQGKVTTKVGSKVSVSIKKTIKIGVGCKTGKCGGHKAEDKTPEEENVEVPAGSVGQEQPAGEEEDGEAVPIPSDGEDAEDSVPVVVTKPGSCGSYVCKAKPKVSVVVKKKVVVVVGKCKTGKCGHKGAPQEEAAEENVEAPSGGAGQEQPAEEEATSEEKPKYPKPVCRSCGTCGSGKCGHKETQEEENVEAPTDGAGQEQPAEEAVETPVVTPPKKQTVVIKKKIIIGSCKSGNCGGKHKPQPQPQPQPQEEAVEENVEAPTDGAGQEQPAEEAVETPVVTPPKKQTVVIKKKVNVKVGVKVGAGKCKSGACGGHAGEENVEAPSNGAGQEQPAGSNEESATTKPVHKGCTSCRTQK